MGYTLATRDYSRNMMDRSTTLSLDTTSWASYQAPDSAVTYDISVGKVQVNSKYTVKIESPVPLEATGCFVKYNFPKEL